ncbi:MAG: glycine cleavage system aminomethyltransferase GcvT [Nitrososphaeria archaeon]
MANNLKRTHLIDFHRKYGQITKFAGFEHALWYDGIQSEHMVVREAVGVFDVTHMGRTIVEGDDAIMFLERILPRKISNMVVKQGRYSFFLNEKGGMVDDLTLFRLSEKKFLLVYNAGNREKDFFWMQKNSIGYDVRLEDVSDQVVMLAVQGPKAINTLQTICDTNLTTIKRYWCEWIKLKEHSVLVTRTGYTGEDGFEIYLWDTPLERKEKAETLLYLILKAGEPYGIKPCGLGARDTLRLEAGMCLYDHDIDDTTTPLEAGLGMLVDFDKQDFIGKESLIKQRESGLTRSRVCIRLEEKGIPRSGFEIYHNNSKIGSLTSGTYSPLLKTGIGMGYVGVEYAAVGTEAYVKIRDNFVRSRVVEAPFYDTSKYGVKRKT